MVSIDKKQRLGGYSHYRMREIRRKSKKWTEKDLNIKLD